MTGAGAAPATIGDPWHTGWFFVAPAAAVAEDGDHVTVDLPDLSITIQNFRGTLAGFRNVCSHRSAQMRPCGRDRGPLRCPYHGWTYNREGVPVGIPENDALFGLDAEAKRRLALTPVAVEVFGPLLFARIASAGVGLYNALGPIAALLQNGESGNAACIAERVLTLDAPWPGVLSHWRMTESTRSHLSFSNLIVDWLGDWMLFRAVLPAAEGRTLIQLTLFHGDEQSPDNAPGELRCLFRHTL